MKNRKLIAIIIVGVVVGVLVSKIVIFMWNEGIWLEIFRWLWSFYEGLLFVLAAITAAYTALYYIDKIPVKES